MNNKFKSFCFLFTLFLSGLLLAQEEYIKVQKFQETYRRAVVIPPDNASPETSKGYNHTITEGSLKWIHEDPNEFVLDVEIQKTTTDYRDARTEELPNKYEEDRKKWSNPYTARVWCRRGDPGECKIKIIKNKDENDYLGTQYTRVFRMLDYLLLFTNSIQFEAKLKDGQIDCIINYIDKINCEEKYTRDLKDGNRPVGLSLVYDCQDKTCAATLQSYNFGTTEFLKYYYLYDPLTKKISKMNWTQIQITDLTNLAKLTSAELYQHLNDPDAPLRKIFYEIKLSE